MEENNQATLLQDPPEQEAAPATGRNYVGRKETVGFILFDAAVNINFVKDKTEFHDRVLNIDKGMQALFGPVMTAWDIVNDIFMAAIVDKTRTRFGKFRPYLMAYPLYSVPIAMVFYALPYLFLGTDSTFLPKVLIWVAMKMLSDLSQTTYDIARGGMLANITPNPEERLRLLTKANFFSMFGEDLPKQAFDIIRDIISRSLVSDVLKINAQMRLLFFGFGVGAILVSAGLSMYFAVISQERIMASDAAKEKAPSFREVLRSLRGNRPLFMLMLSEILDGIKVKDQKDVYTKAVLNFATFDVIAGIPGSPISYLSYAFVPKLRKRFSTKSLWILSSYVDAPIYFLLYFFGLTKVTNATKIAAGKIYRYQDLVPMLIGFGVQKTLKMCFYGTYKIIPDELRNECIDYGEWKNGFRSEGMTGALKGTAKKVAETFGSTVSNLILKVMGFQTGEENYTNQNVTAAKAAFALSTIWPTAMGLISIVPKLLYNINQKDREQMYADLADRRAAASELLQGFEEA